jgi:hypothetical protein
LAFAFEHDFMSVGEGFVGAFFLDRAFKDLALNRLKLDECFVDRAFFEGLSALEVNGDVRSIVCLITLFKQEFSIEALAGAVAEDVLDSFLCFVDLGVEVGDVVADDVPVPVAEIGISDLLVFFNSFWD